MHADRRRCRQAIRKAGMQKETGRQVSRKYGTFAVRQARDNREIRQAIRSDV